MEASSKQELKEWFLKFSDDMVQMFGFSITTIFLITSFDLIFSNPWAIIVQFGVEWFHKSYWWSGPSVPPKNVTLMNTQQL